MRNLSPLLSVIVLLFFVVGFAYAGGEQQAAEPEGPVKIDWWTHQRHDLEYVKKMVEYFNQMQDKIEVILTSHTEGMGEAVNLAYESGTAPDTMSAVPDVNSYIELQRVLPVEDYLTEGRLAKFEPYRMRHVNSFDGKFYSLPNVGFTFRLVWNKELFEAAGLDPEAPPETYSEVIDYARRITEYGAQQDPKKYGFMLPTTETWIWFQYVDTLSAIAGDWHYDYENGEYQYVNHEPILDFYMTMQEEGSLFPGGLQMNNDPARAQFSEGNVGMMIAASWDVGVFNDQFPAKIEWGVAPLPTPDSGRDGANLMTGGASFWLGSQAEYPDLAAEWLYYMVDDEYMYGYYSGGYGIPIRPEIAQNAPEQPTADGFAGFASTEFDGFYPPTPPGLRLEGPDRGNVYNSIRSGNVDMTEALLDLDERMNAAQDEAEADGAFDLDEFTTDDWDPMNPNDM
jgi:multiple sugar transport system substrate-binding protein